MPHKQDSEPHIVVLEGELQSSSEKAYKFYDGERSIWVPKSLCKWDAVTKQLTMPEWLAKDKGMV